MDNKINIKFDRDRNKHKRDYMGVSLGFFLIPKPISDSIDNGFKFDIVLSKKHLLFKKSIFDFLGIKNQITDENCIEVFCNTKDEYLDACFVEYNYYYDFLEGDDDLSSLLSRVATLIENNRPKILMMPIEF